MDKFTQNIALFVALLITTLLSACVEESSLIDRSGSFKKPPAPPISIITTPYSRAVELQWDNVPYATLYNIYTAASNELTVDNYASLPEGRHINSTTSNAYFDGLNNDTDYYFLVTSSNYYGESSAGDLVRATPVPTPPRAPTGINVIASDSKATLSWDNDIDATSYRVYMASDSNINLVNYSTLADGVMIEVTNPAVVIDSLVNNRPYYFLLTSINSIGESETSSLITAIPEILPIAVISTTMGDITLELYNQLAPISVANFKAYADEIFYNGTIFHRVVNDGNIGSIIQGGGFTQGMVEKATNSPILNEADNGLSNTYGTIAMARLPDDPHSATSQFFINTFDNIFLDYVDENNWGYAVFGRVIDGMNTVVLAIKKVPVETSSGHENVPVDDVVINSITVNYNP